jgi:hypothetical protein
MPRLPSGRAGLHITGQLMDFEQFAEAGCRAMGFEKWEFVDAYRDNRHGSMVVAAEATAVGRAIHKMMMANAEGFVGNTQKLLEKLEMFRGDAHWREWPRSPNKLGSELSRLRKPLAAIGIELKRIDRRAEGGSQKDVVLGWKEKREA